MFEVIAALAIALVLFGVLWYAVKASPEKQQYPKKEELDDFFWDEDYNKRNDNFLG